MADSTEFEKRKEEEYEMQLLGFHSRAVYTTLKSIVQDVINVKCEKLCKTLKTKYNSNTKKLNELDENEKRLVKIYCTRAIPHFKIIENTINKFISIPRNVLLREDKCQNIQYTDEEFQRLQERLKNLQERAKRAVILNAALTEELATVNQLEDYVNRSNTMCDIIEKSSASQHKTSNMLRVVENYKEFDKKLSGLCAKKQKEKYNPFENFKGKICDFNSL